MLFLKSNAVFSEMEKHIIEATINGSNPADYTPCEATLSSIKRDIAYKVNGGSWAHTISQIWAQGLVNGGVLCLFVCLVVAAINERNNTELARQPIRTARPYSRRLEDNA